MEYILKNLPEGYTFYERQRPPRQGQGQRMVSMRIQSSRLHMH